MNSGAAHGRGDVPQEPRARVIRVLLWLTVLAAAFNFTPALFTTATLLETSTATKVAKDVPVGLLMLALAVIIWRDRGYLRLSLRHAPRAFTRRASREDLLAALLVACLLMAGVMLVNAIFIQYPSAGTAVSARYYVLYPLLACMLALVPVATRDLRLLATGVVVLCALQGVLAITEYIGIWGPSTFANYVQLFGYLYPRAIGTLGNPNNLGLFLGFGIILLSTGATLLTTRQRHLVGALVVTGIALAFSRTVVLALAVTFAVTMRGAQPGRRRVLRSFAVLGAAFVVAALMLAARFLAGGIPNAFDVLGTRESTIPEGFARWTSDATTFLLGEGFSTATFLDASGAIRESVTDNMLLTLGIEGGLVAVVVFLMCIVPACRAMWSEPRESDAGIICRRYTIFFLLYAPYAVNFRLFPAALFFWLLVGLALSGSLTPRLPDEPAGDGEHRGSPVARAPATQAPDAVAAGSAP